jgi:hypothetical protein
MKHYVHHVPGRLRVRVPALRQQPGKSGEVETLLDLYGVERVEIRALTGSVVVHYDPEVVSPDVMLRVLAEGGYYDASQAIGGDEAMRNMASRAGRRVSRAVFGWAVGRALEANGLSLLAAFI